MENAAIAGGSHTDFRQVQPKSPGSPCRAPPIPACKHSRQAGRAGAAGAAEFIDRHSWLDWRSVRNPSVYRTPRVCLNSALILQNGASAIKRE